MEFEIIIGDEPESGVEVEILTGPDCEIERPLEEWLVLHEAREVALDADEVAQEGSAP